MLQVPAAAGRFLAYLLGLRVEPVAPFALLIGAHSDVSEGYLRLAHDPSSSFWLGKMVHLLYTHDAARGVQQSPVSRTDTAYVARCTFVRE